MKYSIIGLGLGLGIALLFAFGYLVTTGLLWVVIKLMGIGFHYYPSWNIWAVGGVIYILWSLFSPKK